MPQLDDPRREAFCRHIVAMEKRNGKKAAELAGYPVGSAHVQASRLLRNAKVLARIEELAVNALAPDATPLAPDAPLEEHAQKLSALEERAEQIVRHVEYTAKSDIGQLADFLNLPGLKDLPDDIRYAIHSIDITEAIRKDADGEPYVERTYKVRLHDKLGAAKLWLQKFALISPPQSAAKRPGEGLGDDAEITVTMVIPKASG